MREFQAFVSHSAGLKNGLAAVDHIQQITSMPQELAVKWLSFITRENEQVTYRMANESYEIIPSPRCSRGTESRPRASCGTLLRIWPCHPVNLSCRLMS
jgi:hypothetical protein